jgi:hypothetical protein
MQTNHQKALSPPRYEEVVAHLDTLNAYYAKYRTKSDANAGDKEEYEDMLTWFLVRGVPINLVHKSGQACWQMRKDIASKAAVFHALRQGGQLTVKQLAARTGYDLDWITGAIVDLIGEGKIGTVWMTPYHDAMSYEIKHFPWAQKQTT